MTRVILVKYGSYAPCSQDLFPLHVKGGAQIHSVSRQLKDILGELDSENVTCVSSNFRPARESLHYLLEKLVYTNSNLDNWEKQKIITNKISIFDHWTLPNNKLSYSVIEKYMDYKKFIESTSYEQNVLDDIENCTTPYMICGVHGRTIDLILGSFDLKKAVQLFSRHDGFSDRNILSNGQVVVLDTHKRKIIATIVPEISTEYV